MAFTKDKEKEPAPVDVRATADADGFTVLDTDHLLGPVGCRDRVVRSNYEHVSEAPDGAWIYRRM